MQNRKSTGTKRTFSTHIEIPLENRFALIQLLNQHLADTSDLRSQVKQAHWNVKGHRFYSLHLLFDEIAGELLEFTDQIAERVTSLGGFAEGTVRMAASSSNMPELPIEAVTGTELLHALVERVGLLAASLRQGIEKSDEQGDPTTADLLTQISSTIDKRLWFLEAHLQEDAD